jgi:hypothetical protein
MLDRKLTVGKSKTMGGEGPSTASRTVQEWSATGQMPRLSISCFHRKSMVLPASLEFGMVLLHPTV